MIVQTFGSPFSHGDSSCDSFKPTNHVWHVGKTKDSEVEVYLDYDMLGGIRSSGTNKFLWLCESREITPEQHSLLIHNYEKLLSVYKRIFTHDREIVKLHDRIEYVPPASNAAWVKKDHQKLYDKSKLVSMVSSGKEMCAGHVKRNELARHFSNHEINVEMFGRSTNPFATKEQVLADYMFSITVENGSYSNYYTEKIMDCFATGCVPVYLGSPEIGEMFNSKGIITLDENFDLSTLNKDLYESMRDAIQENFELQREHKIADDVVFDRIKECL